MIFVGDLDSGGNDAVIAKLLIELREGIAVICVFGFEGIAQFDLNAAETLNITAECKFLPTEVYGQCKRIGENEN